LAASPKQRAQPGLPLRGLKIDCRGLALLAALDLVANPLAFDQVAQPGTLDSGDMDNTSFEPSSGWMNP
jgi:hypothetical protein